MASVLFSVTPTGIPALSFLHKEIVAVCTRAHKRTLAGQLQLHGVLVTDILKSPSGCLDNDFCFVVQCWDTGRNELGRFARYMTRGNSFKDVLITER